MIRPRDVTALMRREFGSATSSNVKGNEWDAGSVAFTHCRSDAAERYDFAVVRRDRLFQDVQHGQCFDDLEGFEAYGDYAQKEGEWITRVTHGLARPGVRVFHDATVLVSRNALALHGPLDNGSAVDDIVVSRERDITNRDQVVVMDHAAVLALTDPRLDTPR
jgi:hypothetical protein